MREYTKRIQYLMCRLFWFVRYLRCYIIHFGRNSAGGVFFRRAGSDDLPEGLTAQMIADKKRKELIPPHRRMAVEQLDPETGQLLLFLARIKLLLPSLQDCHKQRLIMSEFKPRAFWWLECTSHMLNHSKSTVFMPNPRFGPVLVFLYSRCLLQMF